MSAWQTDAAQKCRRRNGVVAALAASAAWLGMAGAAWPADLRRPAVLPALPEARVSAYPPAWPDPGPTSTNGYYGYYGYDIQGVPYYGLYSENVTCLRSAITPRGYRVVDVCQPE